MQYLVNGKVFNEDEIEEARKYEEKLRAKEEEKEKKKKEEQQRFKELKELEKKYVEEVNRFYKDYGYCKLDLSKISGGFARLFDDFEFNLFKY